MTEPTSIQGGASVHSSTVVRRTEAGSAELATPAHGLSLAQRRFLTLLDTSCTVDELTHRHRAEAGKLDRDLTRLAQLGLVACDAPIPANDPALPPPATVRLGGASGTGRRLAYVLLLVAIGALAWLAWQHWGIPFAATGNDAGGTHPVQPAIDRSQERSAADPQPIATRVLKNDPVERPRDAKDARAGSKGVEARTDNATGKARSALPVEHGSPAPPDDTQAPPVGAHGPLRPTPLPTGPSVPERSAATPLPASPAATPTPATPAPSVPPATAAAHAAPMTPQTALATKPALAGAAASTTSMTTPALGIPPSATPASVTPAAVTRAVAPALDARRAIDARPGTTPPVQLATAAPAAGLLRAAPVPAPALVPIARESPTFPREAIAAGLSGGNVKARLTIDAKGNVGDVAIVETSHRAFTRAVRDTLARWRFEPGAAGRTTTVDVAFKRD